MEEQAHPQVLRGLTILAIHDRHFRNAALSDLEGTLSSYAIFPNEQEMAQIRDFHSRVAGMSDRDIIRLLTEGDIPEPGR